MFDKFGNFDSFEAINEAAWNQLAQKDYEAIREIAAENGIDPEDAEDFISGDTDKLCTILSAALGKLAIEEKELKIGGLMLDWLNYLQALCTENRDFSKAVRRTDKTLAGALGAVLKDAFESRNPVDEKIVSAAGIKINGRVDFGVPREARVRNLLREYYLGGAA